MAAVVAAAAPTAKEGIPADRVAVARPRVVTTVVTRVGISSASPLRPARRRAVSWRSRARSCRGPPRPRPHRSRTRNSRKASRSPRAKSPRAKARAKVIVGAAGAVAGVAAVAVATNLPSTASSRLRVPRRARLPMAQPRTNSRTARMPRPPTRRSWLFRDRNEAPAEADRGPRRASCRRRSTTWTRSPQRRVPRGPPRSAPSGADSPVPRPFGRPPVWRRSPTTTKISRSRPSRSTCSPSSVAARAAAARAVAVPGAVAVVVSAARTPQPSNASVTAVVVAAVPAASPSRPAVAGAVAVAAAVPRAVAVGSSPRVGRGPSARIASIVLRARAARSGARSRRSSSRCSGHRCSAAGPL